VSAKGIIQGSANLDYSCVEEVDEGEEEEERTGGRERDNDRLTPADSTHSSVDAERNGPESQSPAAVPVNTSATAGNSGRNTPRDAAFDASQEVRHRSESEGRETRRTRTDGNEEISKTDNPPTPPKQSKRKSSEPPSLLFRISIMLCPPLGQFLAFLPLAISRL
jgi:hypothetical protein